MKADAIADRRILVAQALLAHKTERQIAVELKIGKGTVSRDVQALRAEWQTHRLAAADQVASEDLQRLAALEAAVWNGALSGDHQAIDRVLKIMERRAKLLGIDAPERLELFKREEAQRMAEQFGLNAEELIADVERLYAGRD